MWLLVASPFFQNQIRPPLPPPQATTWPVGRKPTPQAVPWKASFGLSCTGLPVFQSMTMTSGLPTPANAFDTFVIPEQASRSPVESNAIPRAPPMSARKPGSYL
jgi:hypothetical protein